MTVAGTASIHIITTGGTIDKEYSIRGELVVGDAMAPSLIATARTNIEVSFEAVCRKDSLELSDEDRAAIRAGVARSGNTKIIVTHGTDTMVRTGLALRGLPGKTIVLTGAMQPARMRDSDAAANLGLAVAAVQLLPEGVYVAMSGLVLPIDRAAKRDDLGVFQDSAPTS
ncbi:asparaginase domain-containing protein [uncultured Jatrophihabitans sp.]|uniref:asparaginase domain-containing protein n=1 Tax=uncultured Jatrophihabitans sp. TaxID=1610747 RepID=UPI0035C95F87